ncbi:hypothetical protein LINGRAHAP2_LOCUS4635 [Linum grandiflorum]
MLKGIKLSLHCPVLTHVLFANDTVIFGRATTHEAMYIKRILVVYAALSGQKINEEKSSLFFPTNTPDDIRCAIVMVLQVNQESKFGKYLRLPAEWGRS